ncbi:APC family permease [Kutzneria viridogrisea]|uniref:Amino acid transporter n=1 Tax=Kutzneria viridogrisea TaxID=47990 RepID=A0ABR6BWG4_9PSEU|nr:amino acid transporter [Kutzneria viridogrisea]
MADDPLASFGYRQQLRRSLSLGDLLVYGLIFMVPIAPFGIFGGVYQESGGMVPLAYVIGAVAMVFTARSYAEMASAFPMAGSVYTYAGRGISPSIGFLAGWAIFLDYVLVPALLYLVAGAAMSSFVPAVPPWLWVIAFVLLNTLVNYLGIQLTARVNRIVLVAELVVLALFLGFGLVALLGGAGQGISARPFYDPATFSLPVVFGAVSVAVLSFLGFDAISTLAEENRGSARQIGRAMIAALVLAAALFVAQTWVAALLVPDPTRLLRDGDPASTAFYDTAAAAAGPWLGVLTALSTAIAWGFACSLVAQAATARLLFAMARDRQLPGFLARVDRRRQSPANATFLVAAVSLAVGVPLALSGDGVPLLTSLVNFGALVALLVLHVSVVVHHVIRGRSRHWVRHLVIPLIGFAVLLYVIVNAKAAARELGLGWLAVGAVVLLVAHIAGRSPRLSGLSEEPE